MPGPDVDVDPVEPVHEPTRLSAGLAVLAAMTGAVLAGSAAAAALVLGLLGVALVAAGVTADSGRALGLGAAASFGAALLAGVAGGGEVTVVVATLAAILSWDLGEQALNLGEQVGRDAPTASGELGHVAASVVLGLAAGGGVLAVYIVAIAGLSTTALAVLSIAAVLLVVALRH